MRPSFPCARDTRVLGIPWLSLIYSFSSRRVYKHARQVISGARVSLVLGIPWQSNRETRVLGLSFSRLNASLGITRLPGKTSSRRWVVRMQHCTVSCTALIKISCWPCLQIARYRKKVPCHWIVVRTGTKESIRRKADKTLFLSVILLLTICWCSFNIRELLAW